MAKSRVRPPSTGVSTTMSALLSPACGRPNEVLSTFTESAGRFAFAAFVTGRPVSGKVGGGGTGAAAVVTVVAGAVVVVATVGAGPGAVTRRVLPAHAPTTSTRASPIGSGA